jgi:hypothetical protein
MLWLPRHADAVTLAFEPLSQQANLGDPLDVAVRVSGLGNLAPPSLSTFDLDVSFDPTVLAYTGAEFGDPVLGDQLDLFALGSLSGETPGLGVVNLFEVSLDLPDDLDNLQAESFVLFTLHFDALTPGTSALALAANELGDAIGDPLSADLGAGSVNVVPEPGSARLLAPGLVLLATWRRRSRCV